MSKYYFLETVLVKGNLKVKALPGQKLKDGSNVSIYKSLCTMP